MKKIFCLLALIPTIVFSQKYEIANWYNFKKGAICLTFDDGTQDHIDNVIPALNSSDLVGTFFVNNLNNYNWAISAIGKGHEIANHTRGHLHLPNIDTNKLTHEIVDFQKELAKELSVNVNTLAYPFGEGGEINADMHYVQDTVSTTHIGARSVTQPINDSAYFYDFYKDDRAYYQANTIHMSGAMTGYDSTFTKVVNYGGLMTYMFHAVGRLGGWDYISLDDFNDFLGVVKSYERDVWVATFEETIMYHRERKGASLVTTSAPFSDGNTWKLNLTDGLADSIYTHDLSIKLVMPSSITGVLGAYQGGTAIPFQIEQDTLIFNAIPDAGEIRFDVVDCVQPADSIIVTGAMTYCLPDSVVIEAPAHKDYVYSWFNGTEKFGGDTNRIVVKESGDFSAIITLNGCPNHTDTTSVEVTGVCGVPVSEFRANKFREFLEEPISYSSNSTNLEGGETYYWDFGEGASLKPGLYGVGPIEVSYESSGKKTVTLIVNGSIGSDTLTKMEYVEITSMNSCGIYQEDFNDKIDGNYIGCFCDYRADIVNNAFRITTGDSIANEWYSVSWYFNDSIQDSTQLAPIDFSDPLFNPVVKIRAKASDTCRLAFSLADTSGKSTAGLLLNQKAFIDVTTEYQTFEIDFSNLFFYEWDNPTSPVDSTQIAALQMSIDEGWKSYPFRNKFGQLTNSQFTGHVDIDWISIGEKCEYDSLIANVVIPDAVCSHAEFNVWNHSSPALENAKFEWSFDSVPTSFDTIVSNESPLTISYAEVGTKTVTLKVTTSNGKVVTLTEKVHVEKCDVGIIKLENEFTLHFANPIQSFVSGRIQCSSDQKGVAVLTDLSGKVQGRKNLQLHSGMNPVQFENLVLSDGIYVLTVYTNTTKKQVKLLSVK